jgi:hypothetical protein
MTVSEQLYIAETLTKEENLKIVNNLRLAKAMGLPLGAAVSYVSTLFSYNIGLFVYNPLTSVAYT